MSSGWSYSQSTSMGSMPLENIMSIYKEDLMESSSSVPASMVDSFCTTSQNLGFCDINVQNNAGSVNATAMGGWTPPNVVLRRDIDLHTSSSILRRSLSQIPTDSGFIEREARFSCFSGGNYGDMVNSFSIPGSINQQYTMGVTPMLGPRGVFSGGRLDSVSVGMSQENETNIIGDSKDVSMSVEHRTSEGSPNSGRKTKSLIRSHNEANQGRIESGNESFEVEISGGGDQAEPLQGEGTCRGTSAKGHGSKKRKKIAQDTELDQVKRTAHPSEATKHNSEIRKGDQSPASTVNKPSGKHGKLGPQASDLQKQEYIHVRARRGQATNSHSLAERVRREKISERMKYLQDIVPGCSKVTGKAVMLDEIINYVQSLQLQVEFLSMKLASVNPRMDFDIEGNTGKDILQPQTVSSSGLGFHSKLSMRYPPGPPLHLSPPGTVQADLHGIGTSSDALKRTINSHMTAMSGGNKVSTSQVPDAWEDELDNVVQTGLVHAAGHSKAEP